MEGKYRQERQEEVEERRQLLQQLPNKQCPRCHSMEPKFGYFNNQNLSQERYLCKNCKRFRTHGGKLRNIPEDLARESVEASPYKIPRVNSLDELFELNSGSQAGRSKGNISQAPTYNHAQLNLTSGNVNTMSVHEQRL